MPLALLDSVRSHLSASPCVFPPTFTDLFVWCAGRDRCVPTDQSAIDDVGARATTDDVQHWPPEQALRPGITPP